MSALNPPNRKDPKFLAAAILLGLVLVAGIVLIGVRTFNGSDGKASPETTATATSKSPGSSSACGLPDGDQAAPATAPPAKWSLAGKTAAPVSEKFGPSKTSNGIHTCFAHNPTGALFAAINYYADTTDPSVGTKRLLSERIFSDENASKANMGEDSDANAPSYQVSGFRIVDATPQRVSVAVVVRSTEGPTAGQQAAVTFTMGWQSGDWRVIVPPNGQPPTTAIASLSGYIAWSGV